MAKKGSPTVTVEVTQSILHWNTTRGEALTILEIVRRARTTEALHIHGESLEAWKLDMDITCTHLNGCPLDLEGLLKANNGDFNHDISGIVGNLDRSTGKLNDCFTPRHHAKAQAAA